MTYCLLGLAEAAAPRSVYAGLTDQVSTRLAELSPSDADPTEVARQIIVAIVDTPRGRRPFRVHVHVDLADDGAEAVDALGDQARTTFYERIGLTDLLTPTA